MVRMYGPGEGACGHVERGGTGLQEPRWCAGDAKRGDPGEGDRARNIVDNHLVGFETWLLLS